MPDPTPAEIEAGAEAFVRALYPDDPRPWSEMAEYYALLAESARTALRAVLPDRDARIRADERGRVVAEIAEVCDEYALRLHGTAAAVMRAGAHHAAAIIRQHARARIRSRATPPEETDHA